MSKKAAQLELHLASAMAKHLLAPSPKFERPESLSQSRLRDSLKCLEGLDKATRLSLPITPPEREAPPPPPRAPSFSADEVSYGSARGEYRPALGQPEIVQALLALQQQRSGSGAPASTVGGAGRHFQSPRPPEVKAQPKPASRIFRSRPSTEEPR